jgi:hypothetical protein
MTMLSSSLTLIMSFVKSRFIRFVQFTCLEKEIRPERCFLILCWKPCRWIYVEKSFQSFKIGYSREKILLTLVCFNFDKPIFLGILMLELRPLFSLYPTFLYFTVCLSSSCLNIIYLLFVSYICIFKLFYLFISYIICFIFFKTFFFKSLLKFTILCFVISYYISIIK